MRMINSRFVIVLSAVLLLCGLALGQQSASPEPNAPTAQTTPTTRKKSPAATEEKLFSPSVAQLFYGLAYELTNRKELTTAQAEQTIVLLMAAMDLDTSTGFATEDMLKILSRPESGEYLQLLYNSLVKYVNKDADYRIVTQAVRALLEQLDQREQREILLSRLMLDLGQSNLAVSSELATELALMYAEKTDNANATRLLAQAYIWNRYNQLAFEKLAELVPKQISPILQLEYLRLKLRENPLDIDTALAFAQYAQRVQLYEVAAGSYEYYADLFGYLYPGRNIPTPIYLDWMTSYYNAPRGQPKCLQMIEQFRKTGRFDLQMEVLAARAAAKTGNTKMAGDILESAEQKAVQLTKQADNVAYYKPLAWYYSFVRPDPNRSLDWANKAYSSEPNSPLAAGLLAFAMVANGQADLAKSLIQNYPDTQVSVLAQANVYLSAGERQSAIDSLRLAVDKDPGSIVAEQTLRILAEQDAEYIPIFDTGLMLASLKQTIGEQVVPQFVSPDNILSFQLNLRGNRFAYGSDFRAFISITNNWYEPLVISDDSLFKGNIRIDADVTGDLEGRFENLFTITTQPTQPIDPGRSILIPVRLYSGPLKGLLLGHPQASLNVQFTAYLEPIITNQGNVASSIPGIEPATAKFERPRVEITTEFLQNRFNSISRGRQGPKIQAARLFAGLLMENREMAENKLPYKATTAEWMAPMFKSALTQTLADNDWTVRVHSITAIVELPFDYEFTNALSKDLNDQHWPVRMMAVSLLAQKQGYNFAKVLDYTAQYDNSISVRNMAMVFGGVAPETDQTPEEPFYKLFQQEPNDVNEPPASSPVF